MTAVHHHQHLAHQHLAHLAAPVPAEVAPGTCSCGCGLRVKGLRRKAADRLADRMRRDVVLLSGALADGTLRDPAAAEALLAEAARLLPLLVARVHGQIDRDEVDRHAVKAWIARVGDLRGDAMAGAGAVGFRGPLLGTAELAYGGLRAPGVVVAVEDTGTTVNTDLRLRVTLEVRPTDGTPFVVRRAVLVPRIALPRVGDAVEVAYDPSDTERFAFRLVPAAPR